MTVVEAPSPAGALPTDEALPECTACGACCFSARYDYLGVFEVDYARMDAAARALLRRDGVQRYMAMAQGHCVALLVQEASRGEGAGQRYLCSIYPMRPDCCRWLVRGSAMCRSLARRSVLR